jgi:hypothetical protein
VISRDKDQNSFFSRISIIIRRARRAQDEVHADKSLNWKKYMIDYRPGPTVIYRALVLLVFLEIPLKAYADPGSGLLLWQVAGAFFVGILYQVRKFFSRNRKKK